MKYETAPFIFEDEKDEIYKYRSAPFIYKEIQDKKKNGTYCAEDYSFDKLIKESEERLKRIKETLNQ